MRASSAPRRRRPRGASGYRGGRHDRARCERGVVLLRGGRDHRRPCHGSRPRAGRCRETSRSSTSSGGWVRWSTRRPTRSPCGGRRLPASSPTWPTSPTRRRRWPSSRRSPRPRRRSRGIGFIRSKESDRIAAVVSELQRCGVDAVEQPDGFVVHPGRATRSDDRDVRRPPHGDELRVARPRDARHRDRDPECVAKTFPAYFVTLEKLSSPGG